MSVNEIRVISNWEGAMHLSAQGLVHVLYFASSVDSWFMSFLKQWYIMHPVFNAISSSIHL